MASLSRQFAEWVVGLKYDDLPMAVVDRAKGLTLHAFSSALVGRGFPDAEQALRMMQEEEGGGGAATVIVEGAKLTKAGAAPVNSEMMFAGGKRDTFRLLTHPGSAISPSTLVSAEPAGASGRASITRPAAGYDMLARMEADLMPGAISRV